MYNILIDITTEDGHQYKKGSRSRLSRVTSAGLQALLDKGIITVYKCPPLEVACGDVDAQALKDEGVSGLAELLDSGTIEAVGRADLRPRVTEVERILGVVPERDLDSGPVVLEVESAEEYEDDQHEVPYEDEQYEDEQYEEQREEYSTMYQEVEDV